ncbi:MAG: Rrf2 family transcriptional regulator [Deltaproteobacteria bacterium]|nr:Rrf2 family transcriptional regulator [Deltaproteobacteria bacterium]
MRLTRAGEYAVRCTLYLSSRNSGQIISRKEISREMDIPGQFLTKIAQQLAKAGILEIVQGAKGGYRLLAPPETLNLLEVIEVIEGELFLNDCVLRPESCFRSPTCAIHRVWEKARDQLRQTLRHATMDKLLDEENCLRGTSGTHSGE